MKRNDDDGNDNNQGKAALVIVFAILILGFAMGRWSATSSCSPHQSWQLQYHRISS